jgi:hypothetical protein
MFLDSPLVRFATKSARVFVWGAVLGIFVCGCWPTPSSADPIVSFDTALSNLPSGQPASVNANLVAGGIEGDVTLSRGSGLTTGSNTSGRFNSASATSTSLADALTASDYFTWTVTPASASTIDFDSVSFSLQISASGAPNYALFSSLDGFTDGDELQFGSLAPAGTTPVAHNFGSGFDAITVATEFRIYLWGASSGAGSASVNTLAMTGLVVPEPTTGMLAGFGAGLLLIRRRARSR